MYNRVVKPVTDRRGHNLTTSQSIKSRQKNSTKRIYAYFKMLPDFPHPASVFLQCCFCSLSLAASINRFQDATVDCEDTNSQGMHTQ